jgi:hypothetical protein
MTFSVVLKIDGVIVANENVPKIFQIIENTSLVVELKILIYDKHFLSPAILDLVLN